MCRWVCCYRIVVVFSSGICMIGPRGEFVSCSHGSWFTEQRARHRGRVVCGARVTHMIYGSCKSSSQRQRKCGSDRADALRNIEHFRQCADRVLPWVLITCLPVSRCVYADLCAASRTLYVLFMYLFDAYRQLVCAQKTIIVCIRVYVRN